MLIAWQTARRRTRDLDAIPGPAGGVGRQNTRPQSGRGGWSHRQTKHLVFTESPLPAPDDWRPGKLRLRAQTGPIRASPGLTAGIRRMVFLHRTGARLRPEPALPSPQLPFALSGTALCGGHAQRARPDGQQTDEQHPDALCTPDFSASPDARRRPAGVALGAARLFSSAPASAPLLGALKMARPPSLPVHLFCPLCVHQTPCNPPSSIMELAVPDDPSRGLPQQLPLDDPSQKTRTPPVVPEPLRRRQHRSCDQCRKGKRACDAAILVRPRGADDSSPASSSASGSSGKTISAVGPCSNCIRWRRECTFEWLRSVQSRTVQRRRKKANRDVGQQNQSQDPDQKRCAEGVPSQNNAFHQVSLPTRLASSQPGADVSEGASLPLGGCDPAATMLPQVPGLNSFAGPSDSGAADLLGADTSGAPWEAPIPGLSFSGGGPAFGDIDGMLDAQDVLFDWIPPNSLNINIPASTATEMNAPTVGHHAFIPYPPSSGCGFPERACHDPTHQHLFPGRRRDSDAVASDPTAASRLSISSQNLNLAKDYARSTVTQNLLRIYHDSMENALSCWLSERNCPYSRGLRQSMQRARPRLQMPSMENEWGPNWSNRICTRVCRLDRAYSTIRGRNLTATEERTVSRALHTTIMAFATQWAQATDRSPWRRDSASHLVSGIPSPPTSDSGPSIQEALWNQAFQALNDAAGIESFRVVFAHIIFSLTQRPLNVAQYIEMMNARRRCSCPREKRAAGRCCNRASGWAELDELFDSDKAPQFLETAVRQMYTYRHKLTSLQRQIAARKRFQQRTDVKGYHMGSATATTFQLPSPPYGRGQCDEPAEPKTELLKADDYETFNLLFWLGVMFDTLSSAMYQRPLVVSDEDSAITSAIPEEEEYQRPNDPKEDSGIDLDGWNLASGYYPPSKPSREQDLWGDFFLHHHLRNKGSAGRQPQRSKVTRWPCSYSEAAETLSDAAPVKVLLFRKVTRLRNLVYRGAGPHHIEAAIQDTLRVCQHWNRTYGPFTLDCVAHHDSLPARIQSWYVLVAGHWHLAAMLLADVIEGIDDAGLGLEPQREARHASRFAHTLRTENAFAAADLARCSLRDSSLWQGQLQDPSFSKAREFHDAVKDDALLTEPWTVVLIQAFSRAGCVLLDLLDEVRAGNNPHDHHQLRNTNANDIFPPPQAATAGEDEVKARCTSCIDALWCLGKKSDMAFLAARTLSNSLEERLRQKQSQMAPAQGQQQQQQQQFGPGPSPQTAVGSDCYEYGYDMLQNGNNGNGNGNGNITINDGLYWDALQLGQIPIVGSLG